jgi:YHS domain-containing protein
VCILLAGPVTPRDRTPIIWLDNLKTASSEAQALDRPILLYFSGKWCPTCLRVERTSLLDKRVVEFIGSHLVAVRINADEFPETAESWNVDRLPTALILNSDGKLLGRIEGYRPADSYLSQLEALSRVPRQSDDRVAPSRARPMALTSAQLQPIQPAPQVIHLAPIEPVELASQSASEAQAAVLPIRLSMQQEPTPNLALNGVCVVTLVDQLKSVPGEAQYSRVFEGATHWFAGPEELKKFDANPSPYAPEAAGKCVVSRIQAGAEVSGSPRYAAVYRGRLFLFAGPEQRSRFQANPRFYADSVSSSESTPTTSIAPIIVPQQPREPDTRH